MLDNLDLFDQSRFGASDDKLRPIGERKEELINFEGFGLEFEDERDLQEAGVDAGQGLGGIAKATKRADRLRKEFEKLMLGTDAQTTKDAPKRKAKVKQELQRQDQQLVLTANDFFDGDTNLLNEASTGFASTRPSNLFVDFHTTADQKTPLFN